MHPLQRKFEKEINEAVEVCHAAAARLYVTSHGGNFSWQLGPDEVLITPTKVNKGKIVFDDMVLVGMDGAQHFASPGRKATGETPIHLGILRKRPDIVSVIHAHPAWLTAMAISKPGLLAKAFLPEPVIEVGPVAVTEYATPLTDDLAATFDPVIMKRNAFIMKNHGMVVLSVEPLPRCFELLEMLETTAQSAIIAQLLGGAKALSKKQVKELGQTLKTRNLRLPGAPGSVKNIAELF